MLTFTYHVFHINQMSKMIINLNNTSYQLWKLLLTQKRLPELSRIYLHTDKKIGLGAPASLAFGPLLVRSTEVVCKSMKI